MVGAGLVKRPLRRLYVELDRWRNELERRPWPTVRATDQRPAVVTVNYRDVPQLVHLLVTLLRVLPERSLHSITVVDNGSTDAERAVLRALDEEGVVQLIERRRRTSHGAGLNAGISAIADAARDGASVPAYVWVLDSDVLVLREDAAQASTAAMQESEVALLGQIHRDMRHAEGGYAHLSSVMLRPELVWRRRIPPFLDGGSPGVEQQRCLRRADLVVRDFPFFRDRYLLHLGQGSLRGVVDRQEQSHPMYRFAVKTYETHYHGNPEGPVIHERLTEQLADELTPLDPASILAACTRRERIRPFLGATWHS